MKLLEYEAKQFFAQEGIRIPKGILASKYEEICTPSSTWPENVVIKAQVDVGGRGKAGGVLMADHTTVIETARKLFNSTIKGVPVKRDPDRRTPCNPARILRDYHDRPRTEQPVILFAEAGGVDIEETAHAKERCDPLGQF